MHVEHLHLCVTFHYLTIVRFRSTLKLTIVIYCVINLIFVYDIASGIGLLNTITTFVHLLKSINKIQRTHKNVY